MAQPMKKEGLLFVPDTTIALPTADELANITGLGTDAAAILQHELPRALDAHSIQRPKRFELPRAFAGAVIIGEDQPQIVLSGEFTTASGGIIIPTGDDVANVNKGTYTPPKLIK